jgi:RNase P/RNase MRP subunit p29
MMPMLACSGATFYSALDSYSPHFYRPRSQQEKEWSMKQALMMATILLLASPLAMAGHVTGLVQDVTDNMIVVKKGKQKLEIARDASTKVEGELKKGARVNVEYGMTATSIEVKESKGKVRGKK